MNRDNRSSSNDPTSELSADQSTQTASGLSSGRRGERDQVRESEVVNRDLETPRRYDQPLGDDDDPVMPSDDATMNTKI
jgi:hypothetical protein